MTSIRCAIRPAALTDWLDHTNHRESCKSIAARRGTPVSTITRRIETVAEVADSHSWSLILEMVESDRPRQVDLTLKHILASLGVDPDPMRFGGSVLPLISAIRRGDEIAVCPENNIAAATQGGKITARVPLPAALAAIVLGWFRVYKSLGNIDLLALTARAPAPGAFAHEVRERFELLSKKTLAPQYMAAATDLNLAAISDPDGMRKRLTEALPPRTAAALVAIILESRQVEPTEKELGLPARSAKVLLADGLDLAMRLNLFPRSRV